MSKQYEEHRAEMERRKASLTSEQKSKIEIKMKMEVERRKYHDEGRIHPLDIEESKAILRLRHSTRAIIDMTDEELCAHEAIARETLRRAGVIFDETADQE